jgi:predicted permease
MLDVLSVTLPIFILVLVGYVATRSKIVGKTDIRGLGIFVIKLALPALIFRSLSQRSFTEILNVDFLIVYALASLSVFFLVFAIARLQAGRSATASALQALGSSVSNSGFIGYPVAALVLGPSAVVALAMAMVVENILMIPLALILAESCSNEGKTLFVVFSDVARRLIGNPLIIAILAGTVFSLSGFKLPQPLFRAIDMLAMASGAVALFVVGGTLVGLRVKGLVSDVGRIVFGKLFLHPAAIFVALLFVPALDPTLRKAMLIFASAPMITIYPLLGLPYGQEEVCAATLMVGTTLSFLTISTLLLIL